ncbi:MAG: type II secretion system F family protein [Deltaproteobacteria bacterium]|nr:type II secretion system F family protein [Deltaproteobacteria bacterium]
MAISFNHKRSSAASKSLKALPGFGTTLRGGIISFFAGPVKPGELIFFTSQLSLMLEIGTPLNSALKAIGNQTENETFKAVIHAMLLDVEEGRQLSDAMKQHPRVFDNVFVGMIKGGESGGFLTNILNRLVEAQEKRQALKTQLRTALTYPAFLSIIGFFVIVFIMVSVLPKFTVFFEGKESILPFTTRFLMTISVSIQKFWWVYILCSAGLVISLKFFKESRTGRILMDRFFVSAPLIAGLSNKIYTCDLLRTLGNLMESHISLLEALEVTRSSIRNQYFRDFVNRIMEHVRQGGRFSRPFAAYPYVLETVKQMVATGEETGNLPKVMLRLARFYDTEVEQELKTLSALIEPMALIVMGAVVAVIVSSIILPLFKLSQMLH